MSTRPFSNGTEVDMFRSNYCDRCQFDDPEGGGCDEFALGVALDEGWPWPLLPIARDERNPLGVDCARFAPVSP